MSFVRAGFIGFLAFVLGALVVFGGAFVHLPTEFKTALTELAERLGAGVNGSVVVGVLLALAGASLWLSSLRLLEQVDDPQIKLFERHWGGLGSEVRGLWAPAPLLVRLCIAAALWLIGVGDLVMSNGAEQDATATHARGAPCAPVSEEP